MRRRDQHLQRPHLLSAALALALLLGAGLAHAQGEHQDRPIPAKVRVDRIEIYKKRRLLKAWSGKRLLKTYKVSIGKGGAGHKRMAGDNRTPEGSYVIDRRHRSKTFHRFLHVSYPNARDRKLFSRRKKRGQLPATARIGGDIGIHGEKRGWTWLPHKWIDWTQGCIAVNNDEIEELFRAVKDRAVVEIRP